ncbi:LamG domain-containing protein [Desulfatibacillum aliphaticivorans]|uniref:LamG domain-containing protein n=1 Tax=Desulfatibacillum aliphaticivorans TaxID=218208 RepID=UPI0003FAE305|nr:LamG domain-containing protein [Desulfatibacillum aliphaticivorans]
MPERLKLNNGHQLISDRTNRSHVLVEAAMDSGARFVKEHRADIPGTGGFEPGNLHVAADGAGPGRFSDGPGITDFYANGKELCAYAGDEMPWGAFFTFSPISIIISDVTFNAASNYITSAAANFISAGFSAGMKITISGSGSNDRSFTIKSITSPSATNNRIITVEDGVADEAAGETVTIQASVGYGGYKDAIDFTDAANNTLATPGNIVEICGGNDDFTKLLLHMEGTERGTTFEDSSPSAKSVAAYGNAHTTTDVFKFGCSSAQFDGAGDYLRVPDSDDWYMGTDPFTIDCWVRFKSLSNQTDKADSFIFCHYQDANNYVCLTLHWGRVLRFAIWVGGVYSFVTSPAFTPAINQWYHVAVARDTDGTSHVLKIYVNGVCLSTRTNTVDWPDLNGALFIGRYPGDDAFSFDGCIDEFRVSKGIARWTSDFAPPVRAYRNAQNRLLGLSTRPLSGANLYVSEPNIEDGTSLSVKTWTGFSLDAVDNLEDGTALGDVVLARDGLVGFSSTVENAAPMHFEGMYLYAYLLEVNGTAPAAELFHASARAPFQPAVDVWDGVYRVPLQAQVYDAANEAYKDYTLEVIEPGDSSLEIGMILNSLAPTEHIILGFEERMAAFQITMYAGKVNTAEAIPTIEYYSHSGWVGVGQVIDQTIANPNRWRTLGKTGMFAYNPPSRDEESMQTMFGTTGYFYRISFNAALSAAVTVDLIYGIPAQQKVEPCDFPSRYANMALGVAHSELKEGNRVDFTMPNAPDVHNGDLSSMGGKQSLYFGGSDKITCAVELFNRFGSNVFLFWLALKASETYLLSGSTPEEFRIYPISYNVGCPAWQTLCTAEVGYQVSGDVVRNVAMWMSASGPVFFDGAVLIPVPGLERFFDRTEDECLNFAAMEACAACYDRAHREYNLLLCVGESAVPNKWVCYDMVRREWFEKVPDQYPLCVFSVTDALGTPYMYGGFADGFMRRLEHGTTWDGEPIGQVIETGDFHPDKSMWNQTRVRHVKVVGMRTDEAVELLIRHARDSRAVYDDLGRPMDMSAGDGRLVRHGRKTGAEKQIGWTHRFRFEADTSDTNKGVRLLKWGIKYATERDDE